MASVATLLVFRAGVVAPRPSLLAALVIALGAALVGELVYVVAGARRGALRVAIAGGRALFLAGVLTALAGGTANWLLSLQGYIVLVEGETARLGAGGQLEGLESGPLGDPRELEIDLALVRVELAPAGGETFDPVSLVETSRRGEPIERQLVGGGRVASVGPILLRQGSFGFAPRIVVERRGVTTFDRLVPFTTRRAGREGTTFAAEMNLRHEGLHLAGEVRLDTLDERLQGHPRLVLAVRGDDEHFGSGELTMGQFAELGEGLRVGFVGLKKWAEIDVARRSYRTPVLVGAAIAAAGLLVWLLAAWRGG